MQTRREFLTGATTTLVLIPVAALGLGTEACSSSSTDGSSGGACNGVASTSSVANNHTHTVCVPTTDLTNPPASGASYTTSIALGHSHTVALTQQQLQSINGGQSVTVTSTGVEPNHDFSIKKA